MAKQKKNPTYIGYSVCDEWKYYSNFKKWYDENYYSVNDERMHLDKDILFKGNRVYSPDTCVFVPQSINTLILRRQKVRGELPLGVRIDKRTGRFEARCNVGQLSEDIERKCVAYKDTPEEAFNSYKVFKEQFIKDVAEKYKDKIPEKLYKALYKYEIEITD